MDALVVKFSSASESSSGERHSTVLAIDSTVLGTDTALF